MQTNYERESVSAVLVYQIPNEDSENIAQEVTDWISKTWILENVTWQQVWRSGPNLENIGVESHHYSDAFNGPPMVKLQTDLLEIMFSVRSTKSYWRDWIILKFNNDIRQTFPDLRGSDLRIERENS